jgi:FKBP-type peptidyl-prolyl cis-trans isomerase
VATLVDGTVFESTEDRGGPIPIILADMAPGVREGLQNVREGGIIKLWVPASLGFGSEEKPGIPADSALLFEFTLHEITDTAPVAPAQ